MTDRHQSFAAFSGSGYPPGVPSAQSSGRHQVSLPSYKPYKSSMPYSYLAGSFPAQEWLRSDRTAQALIVSGQQDSQVTQLAAEAGIPIIEAPRLIQRLSDKGSCHALLVIPKQSLPLSPDCNHLLLDQPSDFGNLGTILRCGAAFGLHDIAIVGHAADIWHPKVLRASMGAMAHLRVQLFPHKNDYLEQFSQHWVYPFMLQSSTPLGAVSWHQPATLAFGNEASGLADEWGQEHSYPGRRGRCQPIRIEQSDLVDSSTWPTAWPLPPTNYRQHNYNIFTI